jgi:hypothetical protein
MLRTLLGTCAVVGALCGASVGQAQACETDADCPEGMGCDLAPAPAFDCRPGEPCDAGVATPTGECEPRPLSCQTDADCPEGLTCVEESGGDGSVGCTAPAPGTDGEVVCDEPAPSEPVRECAFDPVDCETDADCSAPGFECLSVEEGGGVSCSGSAPACAPGEDCPPPEEECVEEPTITVSYCFPVRQDCVVDSECRGTWQCTDLPDGAQRGAPEGWEDATRVCLPEGLALALAGAADFDDGDLGTRTTGADRADAFEQGGAVLPGATGGADANAGDGEGDGLCAITTASRAGSGRGAPAGLVLLAVAALWARRRARG